MCLHIQWVRTRLLQKSASHLSWTDLICICLHRALTAQSRGDIQLAVAAGDPSAVGSAIPFWGSEDAVIAAIMSDAQTKVGCVVWVHVLFEQRTHRKRASSSS